MKKVKFPPVTGTRDFYPNDWAFLQYLFEKMRKVSERFGYQEYEGPILEPLALYEAKSGEELVKKQTFILTDRGGKKLALRPELTPTLARMVAQKQKELIKPIRWFSIGRRWRYEKPQKGRAREYEVKGVEILGIDTFHDSVGGKERGRNIVYHFKCDGISLVHLGDLGCKLTPNQVEDLNGVDILFVPVGGFYTIDLPLVHQIISQLEPKIVIPMHFKTEKHNPEIFGKLNSLDVFLKEMGEEDIRPEKKLKIKSRTQLPEERKIVVLHRT